MTIGVSFTTLQRQSWCLLCFSWLFPLGLEGICSSSTKAALKAKKVRAYRGIATYMVFIRKAKKGFSRAPSFYLKWWDQCHVATSPGDLPWSRGQPMSLTSPVLAGGFFTSSATWEALYHRIIQIISGRYLTELEPPLPPANNTKGQTIFFLFLFLVLLMRVTIERCLINKVSEFRI